MHVRIIAGSLLFWFLGAAAAPAQVVRVPADQPTIQRGIDAASGGGTVLVSPGTYPERIDFKGKAIDVRAAGGPFVTTIDAQGAGSTVRFASNESSTSALIGFTVTGGNATMGGGVFASAASPRLVSLRIIGNNAVVFGAGLYADLNASPIVDSCAFIANASQAHGGAAAFVGPSSSTFVNCAFSRNTASIGGACYLGGSTVQFTNCSFTGNVGSLGGALYQTGGRSDVFNSILWKNRAPQGNQILIVSPGRVNASYSNVEGGWPGTGNLMVDPRFIGNDADDVHLTATSPCRNQGSNTAPNLPFTDFDGNPRIADTTVDIGADEFAPHGYVAGRATPGGRVKITAVGSPGSVAIWAYSVTPGSAVPIPGIFGLFQLGSPFFPVGLPTLDARGTSNLGISFPPSFPPTRVFMQTLIVGSARSDLTPLLVIDVR